MLAKVDHEHRTGGPWYRAVGTFLAWAAGFAGASALLVTVLLLLSDLLSADKLFTARNLSDWMFWASALLMIVGLIAPPPADIEGSSGRSGKDKRSEEADSGLNRTLRRRLRRVYNPWRWRLWASAAFAFGLSVIVGLFS
jgi:hypothetical protein